MATTNETTTRFKVDITELKNGMQAAKRQIALANAEFKAATAGMDNWGKSADGVTAKLSQLNKVQSSQEKILANLEEQYALTVAQMGENSKEAEDLNIKIENQKAALANTKKQVKDYETTLAEMNTTTTQTVTAVESLSRTIASQEADLAELKNAYTNVVLEQGETSREALELGNQIKNLSSELNNNKSALQNATTSADRLDGSMDELEESTESAGDGFTILKGAVATFAGNMATQAVGAIKNGIGAIIGLSESTREFRQDMGTLDTAFQEANLSSTQATATWKELYGVFGEDDRAVEAANNIARMSKNQEDLDRWTKITTGVWGTYQDALPVESLAEAAGETAKVGTVTGALADALNWSSEAATMFAGYMGGDVVTAEDAFNVALSECTNEQERQALITNTLTSLYGSAAEKYGETAKSVTDANKATADLTLAQAELGEKAEPVITTVRQGFADLLGAVLNLTEGMDFSQVAGKVQQGFSYMIDTVLPAVKTGLSWIIDNKDIIIAGIAGIATAMLAWNVVSMIQGVVGAIKAFQLANQGATVAQMALNLAMSLNPIGIIITLVAGLVAAFVVLWNKCDGFREFFINMGKALVSAFQTSVDFIKNIFNTVVEWFKSNWQNILLFLVNPFAGAFKILYEKNEAFRNFVDGIVTSIKEFFINLGTSISNIAKTVWNFIVSVFSPAIEWFSKLFSNIYNTLASIVNVIIGLLKGCWKIICQVFAVAGSWFNSNVIQPVSKFFTNLWNNLKNGAKAAWTFISGVFKTVATWFNTTLIQPVTKFFAGMWSKLTSGASQAWSGIKKVFSTVAGFFGDVFGKAWGKVKDIFSTGGKIFSGIKEGIESAFKSIVNTLIRGINKIVSVPFNAINGMLNKIRNVSVMGISPFTGLWGKNPLSVPKIPELAGGIGRAEKGKQYLLEGNGDEMVLPLAKDSKWLDEVAGRIVDKGGAVGGKPQTVNNNYNYEYNQTNNSPKALSRLEIYRQTKNQLSFAKGV